MVNKRRGLLALAAGTAVTGAAAAAIAYRRGDRTPWPVLSEGERHKVETSDGALLVVDVAGPADGPTVVLAHCWGGDPHNWEAVASTLVTDGHRVVRWFQRGHGPSTAGSDGFGIDRFGDDLAELLEALDLRDVVIAGHSLGGMATQAFVIRHPAVATERVVALLLVATSAGGLRSTPLGRVGSLAKHVGLLDRVLLAPGGHLLVRSSLGKGASRAVVRATRDHFAATPAATRSGVAEAMIAMDYREGGRAITLPTTVVVGTRDALTPVRHSQALAAAIPGARLEVIADAGHSPQFENPSAWLTVLSDFLEEV
jgi:pimeloyl-ACP methyl ester carboxylesterase